jgi:hypothetical protein
LCHNDAQSLVMPGEYFYSDDDSSDNIVTHEVTNVGHDRSQLSPMAEQAKDAMGAKKIGAVAERQEDRSGGRAGLLQG